MKWIVAGILAVTIALTGCRDAEVASHNLSYEADNFRIMRRVVFINGITDKYFLEIVGACSIRADTQDKQLEVTCKTGEEKYKKHFLGLSHNVTYMIEQLEGADVSRYHYTVTFKPQAIIPEVELQGSSQELLRNRK